MKTKNIYLIIGGVINLFTAFLHIIGGQLSLVDPMVASNLDSQVKTELVAAWHMVTIILFASSLVLLRQGFAPSKPSSAVVISIGYLYTLFALTFIVVSLAYGMFAPQWILLLPIGVLAFLGDRKSS